MIDALLDGAILADRLGERTDFEEAHQHRVGASAVETGLVGDDAIALIVVLEHVVTAC